MYIGYPYFYNKDHYIVNFRNREVKSRGQSTTGRKNNSWLGNIRNCTNTAGETLIYQAWNEVKLFQCWSLRSRETAFRWTRIKRFV